MKEKIIIAQIRGKGILKRCRKEKRIFIKGSGLTSQEALKMLKENIIKEIQSYRKFEFMESIELFNAEKGNGIIMRSLLPWVNKEINGYYTVPFEYLNCV